jgi:phage/plasmid-like protein (TIGR03299 family)
MIKNGQASMFYVGELPWHGLGTRLDRPATAKEAIVAARLNWTVDKVPLLAAVGDSQIVVPDRFAIVRQDGPKQPVLGIVGDDYTPLQNAEAFTFFDPIVGENAAIYHTAGALGNGERIWVLAKLPGHIRVVGEDVSEKYLLLANSHDGKSCVQIKFTPVRVVCQNTLTLALNSGDCLRVLHNPDVQIRLREASKVLGIVNTRFDNLEQSFQAMTRVAMNANRLSDYLHLVYPEEEDEVAQVRVQRDRQWSEYFFDQGRGNKLPGVQGSLWAAFNGVTEWVDHRKTRQNPHQRLTSTWFGDNYRIKARAFRVAEEKMEAWLN